MSYQVEIDKSDVQKLALTIAIIPCLLFAAGFLTATLSQSSIKTLSASTTSNSDLITSSTGTVQTKSAISEVIEPTAVLKEETATQEASESIKEASMASLVSEEKPMQSLAPEEAPIQPLASNDEPQANQLFSVQVAAFQKASNAIDYAVQLKAKGYPAEVTVESNASDISVYKVLYGSFKRDEAIESASNFSLQENTTSFIIARS